MVAGTNRSISSVCETCGQTFGSRNLLFKHLRADHGLKKIRFKDAVQKFAVTEMERAARLEIAWANEEYKVHHTPDLPHERLLFSAHRVHVEADVLKISAKDYYQDPEFKTIYTIQRKNTGTCSKSTDTFEDHIQNQDSTASWGKMELSGAKMFVSGNETLPGKWIVISTVSKSYSVVRTKCTAFRTATDTLGTFL